MVVLNVKRNRARQLSVLIVLAWVLSSCAINNLSGSGQTVKNPAEAESYFDKALSAQRDGDLESAGLLFSKMMESGARSPESLNHYAVFLKNELEIEKAEAVYLKALQDSPDHANTHYNVGILYELYQGDLPKALKHYKAYLRYTENEDSLVNVWIKDLENRIKVATNVEPAQ